MLPIPYLRVFQAKPAPASHHRGSGMTADLPRLKNLWGEVVRSMNAPTSPDSAPEQNRPAPSAQPAALALRPEHRQSQHLGALDFDGPSRNVIPSHPPSRAAPSSPHHDAQARPTGCEPTFAARLLFLLIAVMSWPHTPCAHADRASPCPAPEWRLTNAHRFRVPCRQDVSRRLASERPDRPLEGDTGSFA